MTRSMSLRPFLGSSGPLSECLVRSHWPIFPPIEIYPRPSHSPRSAVRHFCTATMHTALATRCHSTRAPLLLLTRPTNLKRRLHVYTHGEGFLGCLGHGDFKKQHESLPVAALAAKDIRAVSAGWTHSAAICADGELLVWGRPYDVKQPLRINRIQRLVPLVVSAINALANKSELLARPVKIPIVSKPPTTTTAPTPSPPPPVIATQSAATSRSATVAGGNLDAGGATPAAQLASPDGTTSVRAASVACSAGLTVVLTDEGRVFCMGYNRWGQCGQGPENVFTVFEPLLVGGKVLENERVTKLAVGFQQVLVLCESGAVYGWGKGLRGQLGIGGELIELPVRVELPGKVIDLRSGFSHAVAILENGDVYIWGRMQSTEMKKDGRVPVYQDQLYPRKVDVDCGAVEAFCSSFNTLLRMEDGRIMMFGLEADTRKTVHTPIEVDIPPSHPGSFFGGFNDTLLRTQGPSSSISSWHRVQFNSGGASVSPFILPGLAEDRNVDAVSVGWQHTVALVK